MIVIFILSGCTVKKSFESITSLEFVRVEIIYEDEGKYYCYIRPSALQKEKIDYVVFMRK